MITKKLKTITFLFVLALSAAFASSPAMAYDSAAQDSCAVERQDSTFYINDYTRGYTAEVNVLPGQDKMTITFYDEWGREAKLDGVRRISAQALLADGSHQDVLFLTERSLHNKKQSRRSSSTFVARGEWIGNATGFSLKMDVPVEGDTFEMAYHYGCDPLEGKQLAMLISQM
jgi:hypothetical protein